MQSDFELNGQDVRVDCEPDRRLLTILREDFGLIGAKPGCEIGRCGACIVWLDDEPVNACLVMAWQLDGRRITTIEGLRDQPRSAPARDALAAHGAVQCGYCSPAMVMTLTHLLERQPLPSVSEANDLLCGNLCRCTGYGGLRRAVEALFGAGDSARHLP